MPVANDKGFLEWVQFLKVYERDMSDTWKLPTSSLDIIYKFLSTGIRAESLDQIKGKKLFVMGEGGYGDCIWLYRYLLQLRDVCDFVFYGPEPILPLMKHIKTTTELPRNLNDFDYYIWMFDFLHLMNDVGNTGRYLDIPYKKILPDKKEGITRMGFALGNNDTPPDMQYRTIYPEVMNYFISDNIEVYNFSDVENYFLQYNIFKELKSFIDTCNYMQEMDFMICADNVNIHLAGALGLKTYGLFNEKHYQFWFGLPQSSVWYDSVIPLEIEPLDTPRLIAEKIRKLEGLV